MLVLVSTVALADPSVDLWEPKLTVGAKMYVAGDAVNLRSAGRADAPILRELPLGAPVEVLEVGAPATVGVRTAPFLRVKADGGEGWLFGGVLTGARADVDLDADGKREIAVLTFRTDRHQVLRIREAGGAIQELDFGLSDDIGGPAVRIELTATTAAETGLPLLRAYWPGHEMCGSGTDTRWVSWVGDRARIAVTARAWSDAPLFDTTEVVFGPTERRATRTRTWGNDEEPDKVEVAELALQDGVFVATSGGR